MSWEEGKVPVQLLKCNETLTPHRLVLNPKAKRYQQLKQRWTEDYVDNHWAEDSIVLERNSRDFVSRIERIGVNAEAICDVLSAHPRGKSAFRTLVEKATNVRK